jgi:hypothetical protein
MTEPAQTIDAGSRAVERIGIPAAVCAALLAFLFWTEKGHREERTAFLAALDRVTALHDKEREKVDQLVNQQQAYISAVQLAAARGPRGANR